MRTGYLSNTILSSPRETIVRWRHSSRHVRKWRTDSTGVSLNCKSQILTLDNYGGLGGSDAGFTRIEAKMLSREELAGTSAVDPTGV